MVCQTCGAQNLAQTTFCTTCGESLGGLSSARLNPVAQPAALTPQISAASGYQGQQLRDSRVPAPAYAPVPAYPAPAYGYAETAYQAARPPYAIAGKFERWLAFVIDCLVCLPIFVFLLIPLLGVIIAGLGLPAYWLLRDIHGASLGKLMLGLRVVQCDGQPATAGALMLRNLIYAAPHLLHFIPYLGTFLIIFLIVPLKSLEALLVAATDRRLGDRMAGTIVIKAR